MKIRGIIKDHYKQLYADKFDNLDDMDQFYERYLPILTRNNLNRPITVKFLKLITFHTGKHWAQMSSLLNFIKHLRKKLYQVSTISFIRGQKQREHFLTHSKSSTPIPKSSKGLQGKTKSYRPISLMNIDAKTLNKRPRNQNPQCRRRIIHCNKVEFIPSI